MTWWQLSLIVLVILWLMSRDWIFEWFMDWWIWRWLDTPAGNRVGWALIAWGMAGMASLGVFPAFGLVPAGGWWLPRLLLAVLAGLWLLVGVLMLTGEMNVQ